MIILDHEFTVLIIAGINILANLLIFVSIIIKFIDILLL